MKIIFSSIKNNDIFETDFAHLSSQNGTIEFKHMQGSGGIAVIYAPNGTGKTSLANLLDVEVSTEKNSFVASDDQGNTITPETMAFHVIQDQLNRNVIRGKTTDYLIGAQIRREYELRDQINAAFRNAYEQLSSKYKAEFKVSKVGDYLLTQIESVQDTTHQTAFQYIRSIVNTRQHGKDIDRNTFVAFIRNDENRPNLSEMDSIMLCEGSSDFVLLQYYMRTVYGWTDERTQNIRLDSIKRSRTLKKDENLLTIGGCGGCSKIIPSFEKILQRNSISAVGEAFDKIVIITDRDEVGTEEEFIEKINTSVQKYQLMMKDDIKNNTWLSCEYQNGHGKKQIMELLLLVIPFEDTGAMETFLLNAIANDSAYDAEIIRKGNQFVEEVDKERRYLTKRRYITKSKFDVYFSIRTAAEQFVERQNILKRVPWEQYSQIQEEFQKLKDLT